MAMLPFRTVSQLQKWAELSRTRFVRRVLVSSDKAARKKRVRDSCHRLWARLSVFQSCAVVFSLTQRCGGCLRTKLIVSLSVNNFRGFFCLCVSRAHSSFQLDFWGHFFPSHPFNTWQKVISLPCVPFIIFFCRRSFCRTSSQLFQIAV